MNTTPFSHLEEAIAYLSQNNYEPGDIIPDGKPHRFGPKQAQWYIANEYPLQPNQEPFLVVNFGDWRTGEKHNFYSKQKPTTQEGQAELKRKLEEKKRENEYQLEQSQLQTAIECESKWRSLSEHGTSPYLLKKQIPELYGSRLQEETLYIPCRDIDGKLWSLQLIQSNGDKFFFPGGKTSGCFHLIGTISSPNVIYVAEGFATGASIHLATTFPVAVAFNAHNLERITTLLSKKFPQLQIIVCGDDDQWTQKPDGTRFNAGREKAMKAATKTRFSPIFPSFRNLSSKPTDFNDLHLLEGIVEVRNQIFDAINSLPKLEDNVEGRMYGVLNGCLIWNRHTSEGIKSTPLCNFNARISQEETHDDGAEKRMEFVIEGKSSEGQHLPPAVIPSEKFASMSWINTVWGARIYSYAGNSVKDHLRVAIQSLSGEIRQRIVYTHLGWRQIGGRWFYLHAGGAIGETDGSTIQVSPQEGRLKAYSFSELSASIEETREAIRRSLSFLEMAPLRITAPLFAAIYRAPLGECYEIDFSIFLSGASGCQKSELSAMAQAHFGRTFMRTHLPGNWASTANALERQAFLAKDAIFVVDDFAPTGSANDIARLHKEADRLLRGAGNRSGRERLTADAKAKPQYFSRSMIISSGEDIPKGTSVRARTCIVELSKGDVNLQNLTSIQDSARIGHLATSMAGYLRWLAPQMGSLKDLLPNQFQLLRQQINLGPAHARTPDLVINLWLGLETFFKYARHYEVVDSSQMQTLQNECWNALIEAGKNQAEHHQIEDPTNKFLEMLGAALVSGRAHLADAKTGTIPPDGKRWGWFPEGTVLRASEEPEPDHWRQRGDKIGWISGSEAFLNPSAAYACAQDIARKHNDSIPTSPNTLWKRLVQKGLATRGELGKNLSKRTVEGARQKVLILPDKEVLYGFRNGGNGDTGDIPGPTPS